MQAKRGDPGVVNARAFQSRGGGDFAQLLEVAGAFGYSRSISCARVVEKFERTHVRCYEPEGFAIFALTASSILINGGHGRLNPSPGNFLVASTPSFEPTAISEVA